MSKVSLFRQEAHSFHVLRVPHVFHFVRKATMTASDPERREYFDALAKRAHLRSYFAFHAYISDVAFLFATDVGRLGEPRKLYTRSEGPEGNMLPTSLVLCMTANSTIDDKLREEFIYSRDVKETSEWEGQPLSWYVYQGGKTDACYFLSPESRKVFANRSPLACIFLQKKRPVDLTDPKLFFKGLAELKIEGTVWAPVLVALLNGHIDGFVLLARMSSTDKNAAFADLCYHLCSDGRRGFWDTVMPNWAYFTDSPTLVDENLALLEELYPNASPFVEH